MFRHRSKLPTTTPGHRTTARNAAAPVVVRHPRRMQQLAHVAGSATRPAWCHCARSPAIEATTAAHACIFKAMAGKAGLTAEETARISGHSTRIGASQDMVRFGAELPAIMQAGRWATPVMVARCTRRLTARRGAAVQIAHKRAQF